MDEGNFVYWAPFLLSFITFLPLDFGAECACKEKDGFFITQNTRLQIAAAAEACKKREAAPGINKAGSVRPAGECRYRRKENVPSDGT